MPFVGAQDQPHGRVFVGQCPVFLGVVAVHVHLAHIGMGEAAELQVDDAQAAQAAVKQQQVNVVPGLVNAQAALSAHEGEVAAQFQQEVFQALDQGFFKLAFGIFVLEVQKLQHVGVFDHR